MCLYDIYGFGGCIQSIYKDFETAKHVLSAQFRNNGFFATFWHLSPTFWSKGPKSGLDRNMWNCLINIAKGHAFRRVSVVLGSLGFIKLTFGTLKSSHDHNLNLQALVEDIWCKNMFQYQFMCLYLNITEQNKNLCMQSISIVKALITSCKLRS